MNGNLLPDIFSSVDINQRSSSSQRLLLHRSSSDRLTSVPSQLQAHFQPAMLART